MANSCKSLFTIAFVDDKIKYARMSQYSRE